jgi:hypothetical protein
VSILYFFATHTTWRKLSWEALIKNSFAFIFVSTFYFYFFVRSFVFKINK